MLKSTASYIDNPTSPHTMGTDLNLTLLSCGGEMRDHVRPFSKIQHKAYIQMVPSDKFIKVEQLHVYVSLTLHNSDILQICLVVPYALLLSEIYKDLNNVI